MVTLQKVFKLITLNKVNIKKMIDQVFKSILSKKKRSLIVRQMLDTFEVSKSTVANWLNGRNTPSQIYWGKIADIMGTDVSELFPTTNNQSELTC